MYPSRFVSAPRRFCALPFVFIVCSLTASLLLAAPDAQAGSYSISYSGGSVQVVGGTTYPFTSTDGRSADETVSSSRNTGGNSITVGASGGTSSPAITATFTWVPASGQTSATDPPPTAVIVEQDSYVYWQTSSSDGTGSANSGLPEAVTASTAPSGTSSNVDYSAGAGGASFSVSCTPTASFSGSNGTVKVQYSANVFPVVVGVGGTTPDSSQNPNILVGQPATGTVSVVTGSSQPSPCGLSNFQWNVSGITFQTWSPTTPAIGTAPANPNASYCVLGPVPSTNPASWYWNDLKGASETVSCTATVTLPTGDGSSFNLTVNAPKPIIVQVPTIVANTNFVGNGLILNSTMTARQTSTMMNNGQDYGSTWKTAIAMPPAPAPNFGTGKWCYCQIITPGEFVSSGGAEFETTETKSGAGLDGIFPYNTPAASDGITYYNGDSPYIGPLDPSYDTATLTDSFSTYVMFCPPNSAQWVALSQSSWATDFMAYIPAGGWSTYSPTESVGPININSNFTPGNTFPEWTRIVQSGQAETFVPYQQPQ